MLIVGALAASSFLATLLSQAAVAAPAHWSNGVFLHPRSEKVLRNAPSPLVVKSVTDHHTWHGFRGVEKIFSFGDSYTDSGFNPEGVQPNDTSPLGNPFPNSSMPTWVQYLTFKYNESQIETYNLAVSGSTVDNTVLNVTTAADLVHQISDRFVPNYVTHNAVGWTGSNSLFSFFFGINDVNHSWKKRDGKIHDAIFSSYRRLLDSMYEHGARNFLLQTVPPIDRGPYVDGEEEKVQGPAINDFNYRMAVLFNGFTKAHGDVSVLLFNTNMLFSKTIDDPSTYPQTAIYKNTTGTCKAYESGAIPSLDYFNETCQYAANEYFWLNGLHPTYPIHEALAAQLAIALH
ncbi:MAG: hypothetical protein Q9208_001939 [Pyrenodesmia sp. 3 TL-2023]